MASANEFNALPFHVIKRVVYLACMPRHEESDFEIDLGLKDNPTRPIFAILHTCHSWRQVALSLVFKKGTINLLNASKCEYTIREAFSSIPISMSNVYNPYTRNIDLIIIMSEIIKGTALCRLKLSGYSNFVFSGVSHIKVHITLTSPNKPDYSNAEANIDEFIQQILHMFPALQVVNFFYRALGDQNILHDKPYLSMLVSGLTKNKHTYSAIISSLDKTLYVNTIPKLAELTCFDCAWFDDHLGIANIIYSNAQTLQQLTIYYHSFTGFDALVINKETQNFVQYPNLHSIRLMGRHFPKEHTVSTTNNAVIFPRLKVAAILFQYPFSDDVLFRGNQWRLEEIALAISTQSVKFLAASGVFDPNKSLKLRELVIIEYNNVPNNAVLDNASRQFFQGILAHPNRLLINAPPLLNLLIQSIPTNAQYSNLEELDISSSETIFTDIVLLLKQLPNLRRLTSCISGPGNLYQGMDIGKLLKCVRNELSSNNLKFEKWAIIDTNSVAHAFVAACIYVLADRYSNFCKVGFVKAASAFSINIFQKLHYFKRVPMPDTIIPKLKFNYFTLPTSSLIKIYHEAKESPGSKPCC